MLNAEQLANLDRDGFLVVPDAVPPEMLEALRLCIPTDVCLTNPNIRDEHMVALDVLMGDLRKVAAAIALATGEPS